MKVFCVPVNFPNPETEPEQAEAAKRFISTMGGLAGMTFNRDSGMVVLAFNSIETARAAKWKLEEFSTVGLHIIEGTLTKDGKKLDLHKVMKGE